MSNVCNNRLLLHAGRLQTRRWPGRTHVCAVRVFAVLLTHRTESL